MKKNARMIGSMLLLAAVTGCQTTPSLTLYQPSAEAAATNQSATNSQYEWQARQVNNPKVRVVVPIGTPKEVTPKNVVAFRKYLSSGGRAYVFTSPSGTFESDVVNSGLVFGFDWRANRFLIMPIGGGQPFLDDFQINYGSE